jgi:hypothetical protein
MTNRNFSKSNDQAGRWLKKKAKQIARGATRKRRQQQAVERKIVRQAENKI